MPPLRPLPQLTPPATSSLITRCLTIVIAAVSACLPADEPTHFAAPVSPLISRLCMDCHRGESPNGAIDFEVVLSQNLAESYEVWQSAVEHVSAGTMPPEDMPQPTSLDKELLRTWLKQIEDGIQSRPGMMRPRRLSVHEYRNTLRSVVGFDLEVTVTRAEQTVSETSMVIKLLPTDPPGESGFRNDTHANPLTTVAWDQYSYLADAALERLFSEDGHPFLAELSKERVDWPPTEKQAVQILRTFARLAFRRNLKEARLEQLADRLAETTDENRPTALRFEMKTILMSPAFLYRGLMAEGERGHRQFVDDFELAERLSYFLWADMPDEQLLNLASAGKLGESTEIDRQIERMLASPKAISLTTDFATEWLTLQEIEHVTDNVPRMIALQSQAQDFMNYLFTQQRPLVELVDSETSFINPHTSRMYGQDARQLPRYRKQKGIEVETVPNHRISLISTNERGGILTMPGVLAMNRGPIIRGTWILERILGDELPEPPANVGQVPPDPSGRQTSFRERFEQHRSNPTCAVCHDRIDPLGFALQRFDKNGVFLRPSRNVDAQPIDTSGKLPTGETFENVAELKTILTTSRRNAVVSNIVNRTMSYALCRKLTVYDKPTVDQITSRMLKTDGTWSDLFHAIAHSVPFRETILSDSAVAGN